MKERASAEAVLLDIDGTLLDSNDAHARAWVQAFRRNGRELDFERVRRLIGKGADKVVLELLGVSEDDPLAEAIIDDRRTLFLEQHLPALAPTPGARALIQHLKAQDLTLVVATSASGGELESLLRQAEVLDLIELAATSSDAARSKPDPDIVVEAVRKAGVAPTRAILLGDTPYDVEAAAAAGVDTIALRTGGWDDASLAQAAAIYDSPADLLEKWPRSPIARRRLPGA